MPEAASVLITFFLLDLHYEKILRFLYKNRPTEKYSFNDNLYGTAIHCYYSAPLLTKKDSNYPKRYMKLITTPSKPRQLFPDSSQYSDKATVKYYLHQQCPNPSIAATAPRTASYIIKNTHFILRHYGSLIKCMIYTENFYVQIYRKCNHSRGTKSFKD